MKIEHPFIEGLMILTPKVFEDERGYFMESYNKNNLEAVLKEEFIQDNESLSQKNVLRGLHFQKPPFAQDKLVRVIQGSVLDVAVDLRKKSKTYGAYLAVELSAKNKKQFYVPKGFAHGFLTLEDNTIFCYKCSNYYEKNAEVSLLWNDSSIGIDWNVKNPIISDKDLKGIPFKNFKSPF